MKMSEVRDHMRKSAGYRVHFERRERGMLCSDYFPERDEPPITELEDAWKLAGQWAEVDPASFVNIYVVHAHDWTPVANYEGQTRNVYPPSVLDEPITVGAVDPSASSTGKRSTRDKGSSS